MISIEIKFYIKYIAILKIKWKLRRFHIGINATIWNQTFLKQIFMKNLLFFFSKISIIKKKICLKKILKISTQ